jgi:hypothetical protein
MLIRWPQFGARARAVWHPRIAWDLGLASERCSGSPAAHSENCPLSQPSIISRLAYCSVSEKPHRDAASMLALACALPRPIHPAVGLA